MAKSILDGILCQECGEYIKEGCPDDYPRYCKDCGGDPKTNGATNEEAMQWLEPKMKQYVATGCTYTYRKIFVSWAWRWDSKRKAWIKDIEKNIDDRGVQAIKDLPGVIVMEEEIDED